MRHRTDAYFGAYESRRLDRSGEGARDEGQRIRSVPAGTGFIGSYHAMTLLERDKVRVILSDRDPDLRKLTGFEQGFDKVKDRVAFVQGDLTVLNDVLELFDQHQATGVYHLVALLSAGAEANPTMGFPGR